MPGCVPRDKGIPSPLHIQCHARANRTLPPSPNASSCFIGLQCPTAQEGTCRQLGSQAREGHRLAGLQACSSKELSHFYGQNPYQTKPRRLHTQSIEPWGHGKAWLRTNGIQLGTQTVPGTSAPPLATPPTERDVITPSHPVVHPSPIQATALNRRSSRGPRFGRTYSVPRLTGSCWPLPGRCRGTQIDC